VKFVRLKIVLSGGGVYYLMFLHTFILISPVYTTIYIINLLSWLPKTRIRAHMMLVLVG
jgi:hypothetical protein